MQHQNEQNGPPGPVPATAAGTETGELSGACFSEGLSQTARTPTSIRTALGQDQVEPKLVLTGQGQEMELTAVLARRLDEQSQTNQAKLRLKFGPPSNTEVVVDITCSSRLDEDLKAVSQARKKGVYPVLSYAAQPASGLSITKADAERYGAIEYLESAHHVRLLGVKKMQPDQPVYALFVEDQQLGGIFASIFAFRPPGPDIVSYAEERRARSLIVDMLYQHLVERHGDNFSDPIIAKIKPPKLIWGKLTELNHALQQMRKDLGAEWADIFRDKVFPAMHKHNSAGSEPFACPVYEGQELSQALSISAEEKELAGLLKLLGKLHSIQILGLYGAKGSAYPVLWQGQSPGQVYYLGRFAWDGADTSACIRLLGGLKSPQTFSSGFVMGTLLRRDLPDVINYYGFNLRGIRS